MSLVAPPPFSRQHDADHSAIADLQRRIEKGPLFALAAIIEDDWTPPYFGAVPYIQALGGLNLVADAYGYDRGEDIIGPRAVPQAELHDLRAQLDRIEQHLVKLRLQLNPLGELDADEEQTLQDWLRRHAGQQSEEEEPGLGTAEGG